MTRTEFEAKWDSMMPRERDAWVGKTFGFKPEIIWIATYDKGESSPYTSECRSEVEDWLDDIKENYSDGRYAKCGISHWEHYRPYTTDISSAMEVFEITLDPNRTSIHPVGNGATGLYYQIRYDDELEAEGRTLPEAICKSALICKVVE